MNSRHILSVSLTLLFAASAGASPPAVEGERLSLEVLFLFVSPSRAVHVRIDDVRHAGEQETRVEWAHLSAAGVEVHERRESRLSSPSPLFRDLPAGLPEVRLSGHGDGSLLFTLRDVVPWPVEPHRQGAAHGATVAVASPRSLRLLVEPLVDLPSLLTGHLPDTHRWHRASAHRQGVAVSSHALVTSGDEHQRGRWLHLLRAAGPRSVELDGSPEAFIADVMSACGREVPTAVLLLAEPEGPARLLQVGEPACLPSGQVLLQLEGEVIGPRSNESLSAVLVEPPTRTKAAPSEPLTRRPVGGSHVSPTASSGAGHPPSGQVAGPSGSASKASGA